ncbi:MAG: glucose-1-phosphate adenylyltransferase [Sulfuricella sp.]|nr:glucose-1-phosphate adenylyltransferase [Sulfuricella sp.]
MAVPKILAIVMAGGEGSRLYPLTADNSKPSVPFGARYRIVDFVLSNLVNSEILSIYLLVQYKSQSLIEHVRKAWVMSPLVSSHFVTVVPPQMRVDSRWFQGTADAVHQNLDLIYLHRPDMVAVFGADHIYRMDIRQMVAFHQAQKADVTVAALPVPIADASSFGVIAADPDGRVRDFQEKPVNPSAMPGDPSRAYASMGNYLFNTDVLVAALEEAHKKQEHDFGKHVLPRLKETNKVYAYDFSTNVVPGIKASEEPAYWRDVGTIEAYFAAHMDVLGLQPRFDAFNTSWPIYSSNYQGPVAKFVSGRIENSIFAGGTMVNGASVRNSVVRREVVLEEDVELDECIIMDYVVIKRGSRLRRVIVDRYNVLEENTRIGFDPVADRNRYQVSESGITIVPAGRRGLDFVY